MKNTEKSFLKEVLIFAIAVFITMQLSAQPGPGGPGASGSGIYANGGATGASGPSVPFDGGMSLLFAATGISYAAQKNKKKTSISV